MGFHLGGGLLWVSAASEFKSLLIGLIKCVPIINSLNTALNSKLSQLQSCLILIQSRYKSTCTCVIQREKYIGNFLLFRRKG